MIDDSEATNFAIQRSVNQAFRETLEAMTEAIEGLERRVGGIERFLYKLTNQTTEEHKPCPPKTKPSSPDW